MKVKGSDKDIRAVWFEDGRVRMIEQRKLPASLEIVDFTQYEDVVEAIRNMTTRGAPSIGATAAYAMCLAALTNVDLDVAAKNTKSARPTAYDLFYAVDFMLNELRMGNDPIVAANEYSNMIVNKCEAIGKYGSELIKDGMTLMTHCNAGALATVDIGTALAPMRAAKSQGKNIFVYVSETRPRLQGMQLTAWELVQEGIDCAIIPDGASAHYMREGVDIIIVGADRITSNGDFANKIGTFDKAIAAKHFGIPFYVAAPISTFDMSMKSGNEIIIEERSQTEVTQIAGVDIAPKGAKALNPAFDMTPANLVTGFITEKGVFTPEKIKGVMI